MRKLGVSSKTLYRVALTQNSPLTGPHNWSRCDSLGFIELDPNQKSLPGQRTVERSPNEAVVFPFLCPFLSGYSSQCPMYQYKLAKHREFGWQCWSLFRSRRLSSRLPKLYLWVMSMFMVLIRRDIASHQAPQGNATIPSMYHKARCVVA